MPVEIRVPTLGESVVEATVGRWLKQVGEPVTIGEPLVELETEKVNTELPAGEAGVLQSILRREGETVKPGDALGVIATDGAADASAEAPSGAPDRSDASDDSDTSDLPAARAATPGVTPREPEAQEENGRVRASPLAERMAEELHVDLSQIPPATPGARVTREDVEAFAQSEGRRKTPDDGPRTPAKTSDVEDGPTGKMPVPRAEGPPRPTEVQVPAPPLPAPPPTMVSPPPPGRSAAPGSRPETRERLSRRRLTIARRLVEAQQTAAMLTTFNEVDMSAIIAVRQRRRDAFKEQHGVSLGYMSFFTKATVGALKAFPEVNAELQGEELVLKHYYDIGVAIGDPEGLVVPVVRDADRLTFAQIEQAIAAFAQKARDRALTAEDLRGGTFTITNGGVFGSLLSTPILNPPQVGILGMHKIEERPVAVDREVLVRPMMYLALTYDHRVVDGREAVQFLARVKELIEDPERLLLEG